MKHVSDAHQDLGLAIAARAAPAQAEVAHSTTRPWASVTFNGARHCYTLRIIGPDAADVARDLASRIGCDDFEIDGHLVADIFANDPIFSDGEALLSIEALTVEAA
jgi:hypothetical protein